jgi:hypothetical protein
MTAKRRTEIHSVSTVPDEVFYVNNYSEHFLFILFGADDLLPH